MSKKQKNKFINNATKTTIAAAVVASSFAGINIESAKAENNQSPTEVHSKLIDLKVGEIVKLPMANGTYKEFYVAIKNEDGTVKLLQKDYVSGAKFDLAIIDLRSDSGNGTLGGYLNNVYIDAFSEESKSMFMQNITWLDGYAPMTIALLTTEEYTKVVQDYQLLTDDYEKTFYNGKFVKKSTTGTKIAVGTAGTYESKKFRPAIVLKSNLYVSSDGVVFENTAPTTPILNVPSVQFEHDDKHILGWSSTDAEGDAITYKLEATYDNGANWTTLYEGNERTFEYTVPTNEMNVQFRVTASDGKLSSVSTSNSKTIREVMYYWSKYSNTKTTKLEFDSNELQKTVKLTTHSSGSTAEGLSYGGPEYIYTNYTLSPTKVVLGSKETISKSPKDFYRLVTNNKVQYLEHLTNGVYVNSDSYGQTASSTQNGDFEMTYYVSEFKYDITKYKVLTNQDTKDALIANDIIGTTSAYNENTLNSDGFWYERGQRLLADDVTPPIIELEEQENYAATSQITVKTHDLGTVSTVKWAVGEQDKTYFATSGTEIATGQSTPSSFTVDENGVYTVYAIDDSGNEAVQTIRATKANTPANILSVQAPQLAVTENETSVQISGTYYDREEHNVSVKITMNGQVVGEGTGSNGEFTATINPSVIANGIYDTPFTIVLNDGELEGTPLKLDTTLVKVSDKEDYETLLNLHFDELGKDVTTLPFMEHEAFYNAYASLYNFETNNTFHVNQTKADYHSIKVLFENAISVTGNSSAVETLNERLASAYFSRALVVAESTLSEMNYAIVESVLDFLESEAIEPYTELLNRFEILGQFFEAKSKVAVIEDVVEKHKNKEIADMGNLATEFAAAKEAITKVSNVTGVNNYRTILNLAYNKAYSYYLKNKPSITTEDLLSGSDVLPNQSLEGIYNEFRSVYTSESLHPSYLMKFVNDIYAFMKDVNDTTLQEVNKSADLIKTNLTSDEMTFTVDTALIDSVTNALSVMNDYHTSYTDISVTAPTNLIELGEALNIGRVVDGVQHTEFKNDFDKLAKALIEVAEYNHVEGKKHDENEKLQAENAVNALKGIATFENAPIINKLSSYVENGIPTSTLQVASYGLLYNDTLVVKGNVTDKRIVEGAEQNDLLTQSHVVTMTINGETQQTSTFNTETGEFELSFTSLNGTPGTTTQTVDVTIFDGLTKTTQTITLNVTNVLNVDLADSIFEALITDGVDVSLVDVATDVSTLANDLHALQVTPQAPTASDYAGLMAQVDALNGEQTALDVFVKDTIFGTYEQWLNSVEPTDITIEDLELLEVVTEENKAFVTENLSEIKTLISEKKVVAPIVIADLVSMIDLVQSVSTLSDDIQTALTLTNVDDLTTALTNIQAVYDSIPAWATSLITKYADDMAQITGKLAYLKAVAALNKANETWSVEDFDLAESLINALPNGTEKDELLAQLEELRPLVDANKLAKDLESSENPSQEDLDKLQDLIDNMPDSDRKDELQQVIEVIEAEQAIKKAIENKTTENVATAQTEIADVTSEEKRNELSGKLQIVIDYLDTIAKADSLISNPVETVEYVQQLAEVKAKLVELSTHAQINADDQIVIQEKLTAIDTINATISESLAILTATAAVEKAKETWLLSDFNEAQGLVSLLHESDEKDHLQAELEAIKPFVEANELANSENLTDEEIEALKEIIEKMPNNEHKDRLQQVVEVYEANKAVNKAIANKTDENVALAQKEIADVTSETIKHGLHDKLQIVIDYLAVVEKANEVLAKAEVETTLEVVTEISNVISEINTIKVNPLINENDETVLATLLDALSNAASDLQVELDALNALNDYKKSLSQEDYEKAKELIEQLEDGEFKDSLLAELEELYELKNEIDSKLAELEQLEDNEVSQSIIDELQKLVDQLPSSDLKDELQSIIDDLQSNLDAKLLGQQYVDAENAVTQAETTLDMTDYEYALELVNALPVSQAKQKLLNRLALVLISINNGKVTTIDKIENGGTVTPQEIADLTDEIIYLEFYDEILKEIQALVDMQGSISKEEVTTIVKLVTKFEIAKRSMLVADIEAYELELRNAAIATISNFVEPTVMKVTAEYLTDDSKKADLIALLADMLGQTVEEVTAVIDGLLATEESTETEETTDEVDSETPIVEETTDEVDSETENTETEVENETPTDGDDSVLEELTGGEPNEGSENNDSTDSTVVETDAPTTTEEVENNNVDEEVETVVVSSLEVSVDELESMVETVEITSSEATNNSETPTANEIYLYNAVQALVKVKAYLALGEENEEKLAEVEAFIKTNLLNGAFKATLLTMLDLDVETEGDVTLTPVTPTPPVVEVTPTPTPKPKPPVNGGGSSGSVVGSEKPIETKSPITNEVKNGDYYWKVELTNKEISKHIKDGYLILTADDKATVRVPVSELANADLLELSWVRVNEEHYKMVVKLDGKQMNDFDKKVEVNVVRPTAYLLMGSMGDYTAVPHTYQNGVFMFEVNNFNGVYHFSTAKKSFNDILGLSDRALVEELASRKIIFGTTTSTFSPYSNVTTAQLTAMLTRSLGLKPKFSNVVASSSNHWAKDALQVAYEQGLVKTLGLLENPDNELNRAEAIRIMYRLLVAHGVQAPNATVDFKDAHLLNGDLELQTAVATLQSLGIIEGYNGYLSPKDSFTRIQMAKVLVNTLEVLNKF